MKIYEYLGCLIPVGVFLALALLLRYCDHDSDKQKESNEHYIELINSTAEPEKRIVMLRHLVKQDELSKNEKRLYTGRIVFEYETMPNLDSALIALDNYESEYEKSFFTTIHRANILFQKGDTVSAKNLLLEVINDDVEYKPMFWPTKMFWRWLSSGRAEEFNRYWEYLYNIICQIYAVGSYANINPDHKENIEMITSFFRKHHALDEIVSDYCLLERDHRREIDYFDIERYNIHLSHLYFTDYKASSSSKAEIAKGVLTSRADIISRTIIVADSIYGIDNVRNILTDIGAISAIDFTDLLLIRAFKKYSGIRKDFPTKTTYQDYKAYPKAGYRTITICNPSTFPDGHSAVINQGITKDFVILKCNEWNIRDSLKVFTPNTILQYAGKKKDIVILYDDYTTDTIHITEDKMGALLRFASIPEPVYQMIINDFLKDS